MVQAHAAISDRVATPVWCVEIDVADPIGGEVRIATMAAGICHTDLHALEGGFPARLPAVLGHEGSGVVEAVGLDVTQVRVGDHVVTCLSTYCGDCERCLSGRPYLCLRRGEFERPADAPPRLALGH
jgi:S-(hydroxymethyl)glutathione dehydrogenase/alcohol dehydrogenase